MKPIYISFIFIASSLFSYDLNSIPKNKEVWTDADVYLNHQFILMSGFGRASDYLCLYRSSDYKNFSNLSDNNVSVGFKAILDNPACGTAETNTPWIFKSEQATSSSDLIIEMFNPRETLDTRSKLTLKEETSSANPYGILTLDYGLYLKSLQLALYGATFESTRLENNDIEFKSAVYVDQVVVSPVFNVGEASEFYGSKIIHTPNIGGKGSVSSFYWTGAGGNIFPNGTPQAVGTTNFEYNTNFVRYHRVDGLGAGTTNDRCLKRDVYWSYVPNWFGYGIYDENGDRLTGTGLNISVSFTGKDTAGNDFSGNLIISSGSSIEMNTACKKVQDGSHYDGNNVCPGTAGQVHLPVVIGDETYENFPLFNIPDGQVLIENGSSNEYYVRVLRPRKVYSEVPISSCASLTVPDSMETPDHTFFNHPVQSIPKAGAILVNKHSNTPSKDLFAGGSYYTKSLDYDGDGVVNFLDAFPNDDSKNRDDDHDGIDDSTDEDVIQFTPNVDKKLGFQLYSGYIK